MSSYALFPGKYMFQMFHIRDWNARFSFDTEVVTHDYPRCGARDILIDVIFFIRPLNIMSVSAISNFVWPSPGPYP